MEFTSLFSGFAINLLAAVAIVRFIYYPANPSKNYVFTFLAFNTIVYFVTGLLTSVELSIGAGFGLFAIFSVLRYRTSTMTTRDMTYLFVLIGLPVINSVLVRSDSWPLAAAVNVLVAAILFVLEREWGFHYESVQMIRYERIDLIPPEHRSLLLADLRERTGLPVKRIEIGRINFLNDTAELRLFYDEPRLAHGWCRDGEPNLADDIYLSADNA